MRPAIAMHGIVHARPIALKVKALALEDQVATPDAIREGYERIS